MTEGSLMSIMIIVGPILLLIALVWVINNNRNKKVSEAETERATDELYQSEDARFKDGGD